MTKNDFLNSVPDVLIHPSHGECFMKILNDENNFKAAAYRDKIGAISYTQTATSWEELKTKMRSHLFKMGQLSELENPKV